MTRSGLLGVVLPALLAASACSQEESAPALTENQQADVPPAGAEPEPAGGVDPKSGLIIDENWELVNAHCGACHSTQLITQNRGDRETWLSMIRWMQESQGLWAFDEVTETSILDYLASNYAPPDTGRRAVLDPALLPPNPYDD